LKILIDARMLDHGSVHGIARYTHNLIMWGLQHRPQHTLVVATGDPARWQAMQKDYPTLQVRSLTAAPFHWREHLQWPRLLGDIELAHFPSIAAPVYCGCPYLMTVHDLIPWHFPSSPLHRPYLATVGRWCLAWASGIVCVSQYSKQDLVRTARIRAQRVSVIANGGLDGDPMGTPHQPTRPQTTRPYLLCVTNPRPHKNLGVVLKAYESLSPRYDLVLVCSDTPEIRSIQSRFEGVRRVSGISDAELKQLYREAEAVVVPSTYEGFGIPALEALQMGAPLICSPATSLPEVVGEAGLYFDPHDPGDLAQRCLQLLDSPCLRQQLLAQGRIQAERFTWADSARQHWDLYESVSERRSR
jgi:glycosyltransferase involved in cell wall biosynthesis